jgi:hypothetical protein
MKKIKLFFIRNYQRFIRFLISLSVVSALAFGVLSVSAVSPRYVFRCSRPYISGNNCLYEMAFNNGDYFLFYGVALTSDGSPVRFTSSVSGGTITFEAVNDTDITFCVFYLIDAYGAIYPLTQGVSGYTYLYDCPGAVSVVNCYNCIFPYWKENSDGFFVYGSDNLVCDYLSNLNTLLSQLKDVESSKLQAIINTINSANTSQQAKLDAILKAIQDNKSSAEKEQYSGATTEQKQAQSDLDSADKKISDDTLEARNSTISIFKNFTLPGDIMKGLLTVTNIFNNLCLSIPFAPIVLNFSLAVGAAAFLLGLSAWVIGKFGRSRK